jgi:hypothetical protein
MAYDVLILLLGVALGFVIGAASIMLYFNHLVHLIMGALHGRKPPTAVAADNEGKVARITAKIRQAVELGKEQLDLFAKMDGPNKGASHSKWKNELGAKIRELETQKMGIYQEIVAEGFDPELTMIGADGQPEKVKMSAVLKKAGMDKPLSPPTQPTVAPPKPTPTLKISEPPQAKVLKFTRKDEPKK